MNDEPAAIPTSPEDRARQKRQMADQAVRLAVSSRWDEAANLNREILKLFGEDPESHNRLGKALSELGLIGEARNAYQRALDLEPANAIARRNLDRLAAMPATAPAAQVASQVDTRLFIEETGQSTISTLQAVDTAASALVDAGDLVDLEVQGQAVNVKTIAGAYVGMIEPRIGLRLARMIGSGNQYNAAVVTVAGDEVKVMLRETFQHPSQAGRVSFPQARASERPTERAHIRRSLLMDESGDDDAAIDDGDDEDWDGADDGRMDSPAAEIDVETEDESFD